MTPRLSNEVITQSVAAVIALASLLVSGFRTLPADANNEPTSQRTSADQLPPLSHPNPRAASNMETVANRGDIRKLPAPLKERLVQLAARPHSVLPVHVVDEDLLMDEIDLQLTATCRSICLTNGYCKRVEVRGGGFEPVGSREIADYFPQIPATKGHEGTPIDVPDINREAR